MPEPIITVQGHHTARHPAERALVSVAVQVDGPVRDEVFAAATASADAVRASIAAVPSGVVDWSAGGVRVWSQRPWSNDGAQLDPVHYAALDLTATFSDFAALGTWIETVVSVPGATVNGVEWRLTEATRTTVTTEVRSRAVKDAVAKASVYAQSLGLASVTAIAVADQGMLGDGGTGPVPVHERAMAMKASFDAGGGAPLSLAPEAIEVTAAVDARFLAR